MYKEPIYLLHLRITSKIKSEVELMMSEEVDRIDLHISEAERNFSDEELMDLLKRIEKKLDMLISQRARETASKIN
jgi:hypothetical protein